MPGMMPRQWRRRRSGHFPEEELAMIGAGAVDGVTGRRILSVDGMGIEEHMTVVSRLQEIYERREG